MTPSAPGFERRALNRVTFGARSEDVEHVKHIGWTAWVDEQLNPPVGDDPALAARLQAQTMRLKYLGQAQTDDMPGWPDMDQVRPLRYLTADVPTLWDMTRKVQYSVASEELARIGQELKATTWIRNTHSIFQIREFMVDFWNNHFNIGQQADSFAAAALPDFDQNVIRPRALGNFRDLLGAVATSPAMLRYLNNAASTAAHPNENYAREILELHTLGRSAYLGISAPAGSDSQDAGFTDQDVIALSHALSGWTLEQGQDGPGGALPFTGRFLFNPVQHSGRAGKLMGTDLSALTGAQQGQRALDMAADHPATAAFVCTKLCRRIFGDSPPATVLDRAKTAWLNNRKQPDQIKRVVEAILLGGDEIGGLPSKVRRPYERIIAFFRTTNMEISASETAYTAGRPLGDGIYVWPTPEGRPDTDAQWISVPVNFFIWNMLLLLPFQPAIHTSLATDTPTSATSSAEALVGYWVARMVGSPLRAEGMAALIGDVAAPGGALAAFKIGGITDIEIALRRLVSLIGASPEFAMR
ncbi:MAG: DUF1800 domain-containing protein [Rhodospirillaceae bacterium]|nr:MAG: DUF1800 domain-containing protein [Rhodospirillaceae bacterium]